MKNKLHTTILILAFLPAFSFGQLSANLSQNTSPTCFGLKNGSASVQVSGGVAPYHFSWSPENLDTNTINDLGAGTYHVTVSDNGSSTPVTFSFTLTAPSKLTGAAVIGGTSCQGTEIIIHAAGGTAPYYSGGAALYYAADTFYNNPAGNYSFVVTDHNQCTDTLPVTVTYSPGFQISANFDTACSNGTTKVIVRAVGGSGSFTGVGTFYRGGGMQTFYVQDSVTGCLIIDTVNIPVFPQTVATIAPSGVMMCSNDSVKIATTSSFTSYKWNTGDTASFIYAKAAGAYYVTVTDNNKCHVESNHADVSTFDSPVVSVSQDGDTIIAYNAVAYQWYYNNNMIPGATQPEYVAQKSGEYAVAVTDSNGCKAISSNTNVAITGVQEVKSNVDVNVYPNPSAQGNFQITVTSEMIGNHIEIYNSNGQLIQQFEIEQTTNHVSITTAPGIYIAAIITPNGTFYKKLVKN